MGTSTEKLNPTREIYCPVQSWERTWGSGQLLGIGHVVFGIFQRIASEILDKFTSWQWSATWRQHAIMHVELGVRAFTRSFSVQTEESPIEQSKPLQIQSSTIYSLTFEQQPKGDSSWNGIFVFRKNREKEKQRVLKGSWEDLVNTKDLLVGVFIKGQCGKLSPPSLSQFCNRLACLDSVPKVLAQQSPFSINGLEITCNPQTSTVCSILTDNLEQHINAYEPGYYLGVFEKSRIKEILKSWDENLQWTPHRHVRICHKTEGLPIPIDDWDCVQELAKTDKRPDVIDCAVEDRLRKYAQLLRGGLEGVTIQFSIALWNQGKSFSYLRLQHETERNVETIIERNALLDQLVKQENVADPQINQLALLGTVWQQGAYGTKLEITENGVIKITKAERPHYSNNLYLWRFVPSVISEENLFRLLNEYVASYGNFVVVCPETAIVNGRNLSLTNTHWRNGIGKLISFSPQKSESGIQLKLVANQEINSNNTEKPTISSVHQEWTQVKC